MRNAAAIRPVGHRHRLGYAEYLANSIADEFEADSPRNAPSEAGEFASPLPPVAINRAVVCYEPTDYPPRERRISVHRLGASPARRRREFALRAEFSNARERPYPANERNVNVIGASSFLKLKNIVDDWSVIFWRIYNGAFSEIFRHFHCARWLNWLTCFLPLFFFFQTQCT